jgi:hypothetical protein
MLSKTLLRLALILWASLWWSGLSERVNAQQPTRPVMAQTPVDSTFTYQGYLSRADGSPANGVYDFEFRLYDALTGGNSVGQALTQENITVTAGWFMVDLDFGRGVFTGDRRYLEMAVRPGNSSGAYTLCESRRQLPVSSYSLALPGLWTQPNPTSSNLVGGYGGNQINQGIVGAVIVGGGAAGYPNRVTDNYSVVSGGYYNQAGNGPISFNDSAYATVSGGFANIAGGQYATVGGGWQNVASYDYATVNGGSLNLAGNIHSTIGGGLNNTARGILATIGGGWLNSAVNPYTTVAGGYSNVAKGVYTAIGGGSYNEAYGARAVVAGGDANQASGAYATIPGGRANLAGGDYSFAAGRQARANNPGCFVWADSTEADLNCHVDNRFMVRASGGVYLHTSRDLNSGAALPSGSGAWATLSDRSGKENFAPVDGRGILARLNTIPIQIWNYTTQDPAIRHMGPSAQDFYAAFGIGEDDRYISTVDADGVALAAIQGLYRLTQEQAGQLAVQQEQIAVLQQQNTELLARLAALEALVNGQTGQSK